MISEDGFLPASDQAFLPIVGGSRCTLFPLVDLNMEVIPPIVSMLNMLPHSIHESIGNKDIFSFIPSLDCGSFLYMVDEHNRVKVQAEKDVDHIAAGGNDDEDANVPVE
eukprot:scaffold382165_cov35-Attheya_sp.AAC.1